MDRRDHRPGRVRAGRCARARAGAPGRQAGQHADGQSVRASRPDHIYLADFGLARRLWRAGLTSTGQFLGTVNYVAPEQIQGSRWTAGQTSTRWPAPPSRCSPASRRSSGENGMAVISAQLSEPPPSLSARVPGLPAAVNRVIARALAKSPADRYERCLDFAEALQAACLPKATGCGSGRGRGPITDAGRRAGDARDRRRRRPPGPAQPPSASPGYPAAGTATRPPTAATRPQARATGSPTAATHLRARATRLWARPSRRHRRRASRRSRRSGTGFPPPPGGPDPATFRWSGQPDPGYRDDRGGREPEAVPRRVHRRPGRRPPRAVHRGGRRDLTSYSTTHGTGSAAGSGGRGSGSSAPASPASSSTIPAPPSPPPPGVLTATVRAYYAAINHHHYARAWRLGGRNTGQTYHDLRQRVRRHRPRHRDHPVGVG